MGHFLFLLVFLYGLSIYIVEFIICRKNVFAPDVLVSSLFSFLLAFLTIEICSLTVLILIHHLWKCKMTRLSDRESK